MAVIITNDQATIINAVETDIEEANRNGLSNGTLSPSVTGFQSYSDDSKMDYPDGNATKANDTRKKIKDPFKAALAVLLKALNIQGTFPTIFTNGTKFSGTVALAKLTPGGTNGSMTISSGVVTSYTAPT